MMTVNPKLEQEVETVLGVVARAQNVFGGDSTPPEPPAFGAPRDLEDNLGKGFFVSPAGMAAGYRRSRPDDAATDPGDDFVNNVADALMLGGGWTWADGGAGDRR
jgi:hypothetical protein